MIDLHWASQVVQAYIDPGTGSLILQVLIASLVGGLFLLKVFWERVKTAFANLLSIIKREEKKKEEKEKDSDND